MRKRPKYYSAREGTTWIPWTQRHVSDSELEHKRRQRGVNQQVIWVEGITIHALVFPDGTAWDVVNGWRGGNHWLEFETSPEPNTDFVTIYCANCASKIRITRTIQLTVSKVKCQACGYWNAL